MLPDPIGELDAEAYAAFVTANYVPFENRMEPGIGVTGNQLLIIGGQQGPKLAPQQDARVLDLTPSR